MNKKKIFSFVMTCILVFSGMLSTPEIYGTQKELVFQELPESRGDLVDELTPSSEVLPQTASVTSTVVESITFLKTSVVYGDYQKIEVKLKDNGFYPSKMYMTLANENGETRDLVLYPEKNGGPGSEEKGTYIHEELISFLMKSGTYKVVSYEVVGSMNGKQFTEQNELPYNGTSHPLSKASLQITKRNDIEATLGISDTNAEIGDQIQVKLVFNTPDIIDNEIRISYRVQSKYGHDTIEVILNRVSASVFEGEFEVTPHMFSGTAKLKAISFQQSMTDLEYQELPFVLHNKDAVITFNTIEVAFNSTKITSTELLTPTITVGEDLKVRFTFEKAIELYEIETTYMFVDGFGYMLMPLKPVKISANQYEMTIPSHRLMLMEFKERYEYRLGFRILSKDGGIYFPEEQKVVINRNNKRLYAFAESSVKNSEITVEGDGEFYLKYPKDVGVGEISVAFRGGLTDAVKRITLGVEHLDSSLSDDEFNVYRGIFPVEPYEKERNWKAQNFLTYFNTGFRMQQANYGYFTFSEQVSFEDLSHFQFNVVRANENNVMRIEGANRYETAVSVSRKSFQQTETAILVSGMDFPDALAAGPMAYAFNAPILLAQKDRLNSSTKEELVRLGVRKVFILGGESVISKTVESVLDDMGIKHERVAGSNRYGTSIDVARRFTSSETIEKVILTSAMEYADSLSIGSYAARNGLPILLTHSLTLREDVKEALASFGTKEVVIMGGTSAVSQGIEGELNILGIKTTRISGANRYLTAMESASAYFPNANRAVVASGENFADALAAVPYAAKNNAPIILVRKGSISKTVRNHLNTTGIKDFEIIGGSAAVNSVVEYSIMNARYE